MKKVFTIALAMMASVFSIKALTRPTSILSVEAILQEIESSPVYATCGGGSHGSDKDPVGKKRG